MNYFLEIQVRTRVKLQHTQNRVVANKTTENQKYVTKYEYNGKLPNTVNRLNTF